MERAVFDASIEDLEKVTTLLTDDVKKVYYDHLKKWPAGYLERGVKTLVETYRGRRFPSIALFRRVLDHIEIEDQRPPVQPPSDPLYDNLPCPACNDTGFQLTDNKDYRPGDSGATACFCQCAIGCRIRDGWEAHQNIQKRVEQKRRERREEVPEPIFTQEERYD